MNTRKNTLYNMAYRLFSMLLPLVTAPYLSRVVGTEGVGLYGYAWAISYTFGLIGLLGLENYGPRAIAQAKDDRAVLDRTFSAIWQMQLLVAGVTLLAFCGYAVFIANAEKPLALAFILSSVSCLFNVDWCLMGLDSFKPIAIRNTIAKLLAAAAVFVFVKGPEDLWIYAFAWSLSTLAGCLSCFVSLKGRVSFRPVSWRSALEHLTPCAVLSISVIAVSVYRQLSKVMIGALSTMSQAGMYENADKIILCLAGFIAAIGTVMLPKVSHMTARGMMDEVKKHIDASMELVLCMVCALAFGLMAVSLEFAPLFFGKEFGGSGPLMCLLSLTLIAIGFANVIRTQWVLPQKRDHIFIKSVLAGAVASLVLNALLIPHYGAVGAVMATLAAEFTVPVVQFVLLRRELPYGRYLRYALTYSAFGVAMLLAVRAVQWVGLDGWLLLGLRVAVGAAVYSVLCAAYWMWTGNRRILKVIQRKSAKTAK